jgi:hypothetical protein
MVRELGLVEESVVARIERLDDFNDEYVYDISIKDGDPYFFANNILVHNSCYFSAYEYFKELPEYKNAIWSREMVIEMYDVIADGANATFPDFMANTFNTSRERGGFIKAGRELVASKGLFIKKKKYAVMIYDFEGKRLDKDNSPGKLKAMGLDLKRADTPRVMQQFLERTLTGLLDGKPKQEIYQEIREFRKSFKQRPGWEKGAPKKVSKLSEYAAKLDAINKKGVSDPLKRKEKAKLNMPGHVLASMNWNRMLDLMNDRYSMRINDSARIIVCNLLNNRYGFKSIAYPVDENQLPNWFLELPFDHRDMETKIIDNKLDNLLGVLGWDLTDTKELTGNGFFDFSNG